MQKIEAPIVLVRIDDEFIVDRDHLRRAILADTVKVNFDAAKIKVEHRSHPLEGSFAVMGPCGAYRLRA